MTAPPATAAPPADGERDAFLREAIAGLTARPKRLPGRYLWDEAGSILFDRICSCPDYYPVHCETALLPAVAREIAGRIEPGATIVEFGAGASRKVRALLDALRAPARYVAIDISGEYLAASLDRLAPDYPGVEMIPVRADYSRPVRLPVDLAGPVLGFFPGTSIGNLGPDEARGFLVRARATLGPSRFLIGADTTQDEARLRAVYGGCESLMAAFHLNLLTRMSRELGGEIAPGLFRHEARVLPDPFRVEAHLVAQQDIAWRLGGREIVFARGESVRTDTSHKYAPDAFRALAEQGGWTAERSWIDAHGFGLHLLSA